MREEDMKKMIHKIIDPKTLDSLEKKAKALVTKYTKETESLKSLPAMTIAGSILLERAIGMQISIVGASCYAHFEGLERKERNKKIEETIEKSLKLINVTGRKSADEFLKNHEKVVKDFNENG